MSSEQARHPMKRAVFGFAFAVPLLAGCAYDGGYYDGGYYDDGYYAPPSYGYGYGYYGYSYGYDDWGHRHRHHRRYGHDDDRERGDHGAGNRPPADRDDHASNSPGRPRVVFPRDDERGGFARGDRSSPPNPIWMPTGRDSRR